MKRAHLLVTSSKPASAVDGNDMAGGTGANANVGMLDSPLKHKDVFKASAEGDVADSPSLNLSWHRLRLTTPHKRWADMTSSTAVSSPDTGTSPCGSVQEAAMPPAARRPSPLGAFQCISGFSVTTPGGRRSMDASFPDSDASRLPSSMCGALEPPSVGGFSDDWHIAAAQMQPGMADEAGRSGDEPDTQGYAGLVGMLSSTHCHLQDHTQTHAPFITAVNTGAGEHPMPVKRLVQRAAKGLSVGQKLNPVRDGTGGAYFMHDSSGNRTAIFKPCDEEPLAPNNPKGWAGRPMGYPGMRPSVRVGEAALREVAAYLLDHDGFAGVLPAVLAECWHPGLSYPEASDSAGGGPDEQGSKHGLAPVFSGISQALVLERSRHSAAQSSRGALASMGAQPGQAKVGSLQQYAVHKCDGNDMSPSRFTVPNVHRIGILDIRIFNCDRHAGNILIREHKREECALPCNVDRLEQDMVQLIPIDHGFSLPEAMEAPYFEWLFWPQASLPFGQAELDYIAKLDVQEDIKMLRQHLPLLREECLRCLELMTTVLKELATAGLTLFEIGSMMTRRETLDETLPSDLEVMCIEARSEALSVESPSAASNPSCCILSPRSTQGSMLAWGNALPACDEEDEEDPIFQLESESSKKAAQISHTCLSVGVSDDGSGALLQSPPSFGSPDRGAFMTPAQPMQRNVLSYAGGVECGHTKHVERRAWRHRRNVCDNNRPMYPPPIKADHPDQASYVFSGLNDAQWDVFMRVVRERCLEEIANQTWKHSKNAGATGSCPAVCGRRGHQHSTQPDP